MIRNKSLWMSLLLLMGMVACCPKEMPLPTPTPLPETTYADLGLTFVASEGQNTVEKSYGYTLSFRALAHWDNLGEFSPHSPFYAWIESRVLPAPTISLSADWVSDQELGFSLVSTCADEVRWLCVKQGEEPSVERVLQQGTRVEQLGRVEIRVEGLTPETPYVIYAAAENKYYRILSEPLSMTTRKVGEGANGETTRRFEDVVPEEPEVEEDDELVNAQLQFQPEFFIDGSGYAYFALDRNLVVWSGEELADSEYDLCLAPLGLVAPIPVFEDRDESYYEFRVRIFQPETGGYFVTPWHRLDLGPTRSTITPL